MKGTPAGPQWVVRAGDGATAELVVRRAGGDERAIDEGRVFVGRRRVLASDEPVQEGDVLTIAPPRAASAAVSILADEDEIVAADKPAGMPTLADHGGAAHTLLAAVARAIGADARTLHATSRLDRDVSGVVVFARSGAAAARLERARELGEYARRYVAIAPAAALSPDAGTWDVPIGRAKDPRHRAPNGRDATEARTEYAVVARACRHVLLTLTPLTGRTHQLRVHASHAGAPLLGDRTYGGSSRLTLPSGRVMALDRIALHAARVTIPSSRGEALRIEAPVPRELADLWGALGGEGDAWARALSPSLR